MSTRASKSAPRNKSIKASLAAASLALPLPLEPIATRAYAEPAANKAAVQKAFDAWTAAGTGSPYDLLADGARWTITGNSLASKTYDSRDAFISEVIRPFNARMSVGLKPTIRNIYAEDDTVIVFFDAAGTARDGKAYANTYAWFLHMRDGKIANASAFFGSIAFNDLWQRVSPTAQ